MKSTQVLSVIFLCTVLSTKAANIREKRSYHRVAPPASAFLHSPIRPRYYGSSEERDDYMPPPRSYARIRNPGYSGIHVNLGPRRSGIPGQMLPGVYSTGTQNIGGFLAHLVQSMAQQNNRQGMGQYHHRIVALTLRDVLSRWDFTTSLIFQRQYCYNGMERDLLAAVDQLIRGFGGKTVNEFISQPAGLKLFLVDMLGGSIVRPPAIDSYRLVKSALLALLRQTQYGELYRRVTSYGEEVTTLNNPNPIVLRDEKDPVEKNEDVTETPINLDPILSDPDTLDPILADPLLSDPLTPVDPQPPYADPLTGNDGGYGNFEVDLSTGLFTPKGK